ncbi:hypothetical protein [Maricaulis maris]|uniref:hypothetical protein n=1 Tax=Maricaulis maris TaxID=74318 RepID=UPI0026F1EF09|nr:hypothetical protein [Maricaulis maris]
MAPVASVKFGKFELRVIAAKNGYKGAVIADGKSSPPIEGTDVEDVLSRLRGEASRMSKSFFGFSGAIQRFTSLFPEGFSDPEFLRRERQYKLAAAKRVNASMPLESALSGDVETSSLPNLATNMLSRSEAISWSSILKSGQAARFVQGAAFLATGDIQRGLTQMEQAARKADRPSWPLLTYLPYMWRPAEHMFLKPVVTRDFAERVGHAFAAEYTPEFSELVYLSLLDLAQKTRAEIVELEPRDNIDIQSFIWTVGEYPETLENI